MGIDIGRAIGIDMGIDMGMAMDIDAGHSSSKNGVPLAGMKPIGT